MSTSSKLPSLELLLKKEIAAAGSLSFARFMERALYDPEQGYYPQHAAIGKAGDFYTNVSVGPVFGKILAEQFEEIWMAMECPAAFTLLEQGAFDGKFAQDVLDHLSVHNPEFYAALHYVIVEPFSRLRAAQQESLVAHAKKLSWHRDLDDTPPIEGVFFCNELVDALPAELIEWRDSEWQQLRVVSEGDAFRFAPNRIECETLRRRVAPLPQPAGSGYRTEINLAFEAWISAASEKLRRGVLLLCDYGYPRSVYYSPERTKGTLTCYHKHQKDYNPLMEIGRKDISVHVDFTSLTEAAIENGFQPLGFADQHHFMVGAATKFLKKIEATGLSAEAQRDLRALQTLLHPETMGRAFHYLGLGKEQECTLSGFHHASKGIEKLELQ